MADFSTQNQRFFGRNGKFDFTKNQYTYITHLDQMSESEMREEIRY